MKPKYKDFVLSMSYKNFLVEKTGVPKVMLAHQQMYLASGISYAGLFWVKRRTFKGKILLYSEVGLILDGQFRGVYQLSQAINRFVAWCAHGHRLADIHIHHLVLAELRQIDTILRTFDDVPIKVYLHDYYNACANLILMKNGKDYCGGKGLCQAYCGDCPDFAGSQRVQANIHGMLNNFMPRITFVSPSKVTRNIFLNFHPEHAERTIVIPHQTFTHRYLGNLEPVAENEKIRVAYLGMPVYHKGWETWKRLVDIASQDQYEFIVFNSVDENYAGMEKVDVYFSEKNLNAMTQAMRDKKVHIAIMWSMCPETYSYTCFEAYSANAMLITRTDSGNMEDMVTDYNCGLVLPSEEALLELFDDAGALRSKINAYRMATQGGPENMVENSQIVDITKAGAPDERKRYKKLLCPVNYPLLHWLNKTYKSS